MAPSNIVEIAAAVSEKGCISFPSYARVRHVLDNETITLEVGTEPLGLDIERFWPEDCALSTDRKAQLFWQYHRSMGCHQFVAILAKVIKELCDSGVKLGHEGGEVVDVLVLNSVEFDVSDLLSAKSKDAVLKVHDPVTNTTVPIISTHEQMDRLIGLGEAVCARLGMTLPPLGDSREKLKLHRPESYVGTVPHWWVAAVVEKECGGIKEYRMVHLDICGAAYDASALAETDDNLVSLQTFITPEYQLIPSSDKDTPHKLVMMAFTTERCDFKGCGNMKTPVVLQPKSIRHFRCYHKNDTSTIMATPLATFVERNPLNHINDSNKIGEIVSSIRQKMILQLPVGSEVIVCNIKSKPELNGRSGVVHESSNRDRVAKDRIPVLIQGQKTPVQLKATCISLPKAKRQQYHTLNEILRNHNSLMEKEDHKAKKKAFSRKERAKITPKLDDPAVVKALSVIQTGQVTFTCFGDEEFKRGIEMLLIPPLDAVLPKSSLIIFRNGYDLSNHPKANDAIKLINMMKAGKQRLLQEHPDAVLGNGAIVVPPGSEMDRIQTSVVKKIRSDEGLLFVFQRLEELGLYVNPANWMPIFAKN
jgi:hypothetical protein